jgi:hypothetical protein
MSVLLQPSWKVDRFRDGLASVLSRVGVGIERVTRIVTRAVERVGGQDRTSNGGDSGPGYDRSTKRHAGQFVRRCSKLGFGVSGSKLGGT